MILITVIDFGSSFVWSYGWCRTNNIMKTEKTNKIAEIPPVAFMIFNRPEYTKAVFSEIKKARPKKLFIIADGPRAPSEEAACKEARAIAEDIDWTCEVHKNYAEKNMGLKDRFRSGLNWFFEHVEDGIILEDDCLPHQSFFRFAGEMLEKYRNDDQVMMIGGSNSIADHKPNTSYLFSRYFSIWGWATWRRAWEKYDNTMKEWPRIKKGGLKRYYANKHVIKHLKKSFEDVYSGKTNTWDIQWFFTCLINNGLTVVPSKNLISNIGIDGVHTVGNNQNLPVFDLYETPLKHPINTEGDSLYDSILYKKNFHKNRNSFLKNIRSQIAGFLVQKNTVKKIYRNIVKARLALFGYGVFENVNKTSYAKNCLLLYIVEPFRNPKKDNVSHQNYWQAKELTKIIGEMKYNVDVIQFSDRRAKLTKKYDLVIDLHPGMNILYSDHLNYGAKRIAYITGSNVCFSNQAEKKRLESIYQRRGVRIQPRRQTKPFDKKLLSSFDAMFFMGNEHNLKTYAEYAPKKVFLIKNTGYDFLAGHDGSKKSSKSFLFLAGSGQAHKGLDLLLEVFSKNTNLHLYVCSNFKAEKDFARFYHKELFETPNIHPIGFININSFEFVEIIKKCAYLISPSCSEGQSGSVLAGMSAGLIPIISKESGFNDDEAFLIKDCSVETLVKEIRQFSQKTPEWISEKRLLAEKIAREQFGRNNFSDSIKKALSGVLKNNDKPLISVIIPAHNSAQTMGVAVESIINQTYPNLEIIIIDDNSTDNTKNIVEMITKKHSNIKYYKLPYDDPNRFNKRGRNINAGYMARNYGLEQANGEWVTFQDADDASLLNRIEVQYNTALNYNSSHVCVQCAQLKKEYVGKKLNVEKIFKEKGDVIITKKDILKITKKTKGVLMKILGPIHEFIPFEIKRARLINKLFFGSLDPYPGSGNCPLIKREIIDKIKFNPLNKRIWPSFTGRGADRDFNFRISEMFKNSICLNAPLYLWNPIGKTTDLQEYKKYLYE